MENRNVNIYIYPKTNKKKMEKFILSMRGKEDITDNNFFIDLFDNYTIDYNDEKTKIKPEDIIGLNFELLNNDNGHMKLYFLKNGFEISRPLFSNSNITKIVEKKIEVNGLYILLFITKLKNFINDDEFTKIIDSHINNLSEQIISNEQDKAGKKRKTHKRKHNKKRRKTTKKR